MKSKNFISIDPKNIALEKFQGYLLGAVAPRPIAYASTIDSNGQINLSPFSYFNAFSTNPPILIFSPARRGKDNTTKHTLENVQEVPEVVVNICNYDMVEQMSLSSTEYPRSVNEFEKAGFSMVDSGKITPPRVGESPVAFECKVNDIIALGDQGGAGNLVICEILLVHINTDILDSNQRIDPHKLDVVGRMGGNWYVRANSPTLFEIEKPLTTMGIGVDSMPEIIKNSTILTGNDLGRLGNIEELPSKLEISEMAENSEVIQLKEKFRDNPEKLLAGQHKLAKELLKKGEKMNAWRVLLLEL